MNFNKRLINALICLHEASKNVLDIIALEFTEIDEFSYEILDEQSSRDSPHAAK